MLVFPQYLSCALNTASLTLTFVAQIVMEVRPTPKKDFDAVREALETVRQRVMDECGLFAPIVVSPGTHPHVRVATFHDAVLPKTCCYMSTSLLTKANRDPLTGRREGEDHPQNHLWEDSAAQNPNLAAQRRPGHGIRALRCFEWYDGSSGKVYSPYRPERPSRARGAPANSRDDGSDGARKHTGSGSIQEAHG